MKEWNALDKLVAKFRYSHVNKYVEDGAVIIDIGCGREAAFLKENKDKIKSGTGLDFRITNQQIGNITLINNREMGAFPIESESVDRVFLNAVLEHLEEPITVLSESKRVLKRDGCIVMTTPTRISKPVLEFMAFKMHIINEEEIREHKHYWNKKDVWELAKALDMNVLRYSYFEIGFNSIIVLGKIDGR